MKVVERKVPCGSCTACCRGDAVYLHPECGDDPSQYETERDGDRIMLAHKPNRDCIYLDRDIGCTIHDRRPAICRELDCRDLLAVLGVRAMRKGGLLHIAYAAKRLLKNGLGTRYE